MSRPNNLHIPRSTGEWVDLKRVCDIIGDVGQQVWQGAQRNEGNNGGQGSVKAAENENNINCRPCNNGPDTSQPETGKEDSRRNLEAAAPLVEYGRQHSLSKPPLPPGNRNSLSSSPLPPSRSLPSSENGMADVPPLGAPSRSLGIPSTPCTSIAEDRVQQPSAFAVAATTEQPSSPIGAGHQISLQPAMSLPEQMLHGHPGLQVNRSHSLYGTNGTPGPRSMRRTSSGKSNTLELAPEPTVGASLVSNLETLSKDFISSTLPDCTRARVCLQLTIGACLIADHILGLAMSVFRTDSVLLHLRDLDQVFARGGSSVFTQGIRASLCRLLEPNDKGVAVVEDLEGDPR